MSSEHDIEEIKEGVAEIKRLLKNAGFVGCTPARVFEINQKARRDAESIKRRIDGDKRDRK